MKKNILLAFAALFLCASAASAAMPVRKHRTYRRTTTTRVYHSYMSNSGHYIGSFNLQPKVGLNVTGITSGGSSSKYKCGFIGGLEGEYQVTRVLSLSAALDFSMQGYKSDVSSRGYDLTHTTSLNYINIPLMANFYVARGFALKCGLQPGFNVSDDNTGANSVDLSIPIGMSYEFNNVQLDARYNIGCTDIWSNSGNKNSVFQFTIGYKFDL